MKEYADKAPATLKDEVLAELRAWSAECSDIAREVVRAHGSEEESSAHERRAEEVDDLIGRLKDAALAERSPKLSAAAVEVYADDLADLPPEPTYRYEASCNLPFDSTAVGAIVGYSDDSEDDAAAELKEILAALSLNPADICLLGGETGQELRTADPGGLPDAPHLHREPSGIWRSRSAGPDARHATYLTTSGQTITDAFCVSPAEARAIAHHEGAYVYVLTPAPGEAGVPAGRSTYFRHDGRPLGVASYERTARKHIRYGSVRFTLLDGSEPVPPPVYRVEPTGDEFARGGYHAAREAASGHSYRTEGDATVETLDERGEVVPGGRAARFNKGGPVERYPGTAFPR